MDSPTLCKPTFKLLQKPIFNFEAINEANLEIFKMKNSLKNAKGFPYREARLVDCDGDLTKRWYIVFYCWDLKASKLVRVRDYSINKKDTLTSRKAYAKSLVQMYNYQLLAGYAIGLDKEPEKEKQLLTVWDGITIALKHLNATGRQASIHTFNSFARIFENYLTETKTKNLNINQYKEIDFKNFLLAQKHKKNISNKTYNNYISIFKLFFNTLKKLEYIEKNPIEKVNFVKSDTGRHTVFTSDQKKAILDYCLQHEPQLYFFIHFLYYACIRPKELTFLKVENIVGDKIVIPSNLSKNHQNQFIPLLAPLAAVVEKMGVHQLPGNYLLFSKNGKTKPYAVTYFTRVHLRVLRALHIGESYTLYSWKHTGNVDLYNATKDIMLIHTLNRHHSLDMTKIYLKDLGVFSDYGNIPNLPVL